MTKHTQTWFKLGVAFTILGSFLPWSGEGDLVYYVRSGIDVYWSGVVYWLRGLQEFPIKDNGGLLVVILSILIIVFVFRTPGFVKYPERWTLICATVLSFVSFVHVINLLWQRFEANNDLVGPYVHFGLPVVLLGSLFLLYAGVSDYRKTTPENRRQT